MEQFENIKFEKKGSNLYKMNGAYYRLFAHSVSPNRCWLINPKMVEVKDIDIASGEIINGERVIEFEVCGTVSKYHEFENLKKLIA